MAEVPAAPAAFLAGRASVAFGGVLLRDVPVAPAAVFMERASVAFAGVSRGAGVPSTAKVALVVARDGPSAGALDVDATGRVLGPSSAPRTD